MATRRVELGPTGNTVRANISQVRKRLGLTLRDLSARLPNERPMAHNTISEIERGARRVDVDDLVALAAALEVSPITLLGPPIDPPAEDDSEVDVTGSGSRTGRQLWEWLRANYPIDATADFETEPDAEFRRRCFPHWAFMEDQARESAVAEPVHPADAAMISEVTEVVLSILKRQKESGVGNGDD